MHMTLFYNMPYSVRVVVKKHCITVEIPEKKMAVYKITSVARVYELIFIDGYRREKSWNFICHFCMIYQKKLVLPVFPN